MSTTTDIVLTKETMAEIALLASEVVSNTPLAVADLNQRIVPIAESAGVVFIIVRRLVKEQVDKRLQSCELLPLKNDLAYRAL